MPTSSCALVWIAVALHPGPVVLEEAFAVLRRYARDVSHRLTDVARAVVGRELPAAQILARGRSRR